LPDYILALDQGTTSSRAIVFDRSGLPRAIAQQEISQNYAQPGWVEHDPEDIWRSVVAVGREAITKAQLKPQDIATIGIANQRETTLVWDRRSGVPIYPAIVWQDRRTAAMCDALREHETLFADRTGLVLDPYFSATKIAWLRRNVPGGSSNDLAFGTVDAFLISRLTGGRVHATDFTNASRTLLYDIRRMRWSEELLTTLDIPADMLPTVVPSSGVVAETDPEWFGRPIPIAGIAGDQQAALFGQACFRAGMGKNTYGTGCFLLRHVGRDAPRSQNRLLTSPVAGRAISSAEYALEGSVFSAGGAMQWLRDGLGILETVADSHGLAESVTDTGGVYLVPAFTGLGAPYWDAQARGALVGLTRGTGRAHIARAALESIAYQARDVIEAMDRDCHPAKFSQLRVDGGACANDFLMQFQADILGIPVVRPRVTETTGLGGAFLAGLAVGFWKSCDEIESIWQADRVFEPAMPDEFADERYRGWQDAVRRVILPTAR
jgi:glycerol kinase